MTEMEKALKQKAEAESCIDAIMDQTARAFLASGVIIVECSDPRRQAAFDRLAKAIEAENGKGGDTT